MLYNYYCEVVFEEHMLYAGEIAKLYNLQTIAGTAHELLVRAQLKNYIKNNVKDYYQLYYRGSKGSLRKVYPKAVYVPAMNQLINKLNTYNDNVAYIDGKRYFFKREE